MSLSLPPSVFHVRCMKQTWLAGAPWRVTLSHGNSESVGEAFDVDLAYDIALAKAWSYVPEEKPRPTPLNIIIEL